MEGPKAKYIEAALTAQTRAGLLTERCIRKCLIQMLGPEFEDSGFEAMERRIALHIPMAGEELAPLS